MFERGTLLQCACCVKFEIIAAKFQLLGQDEIAKLLTKKDSKDVNCCLKNIHKINFLSYHKIPEKLENTWKESFCAKVGS